jgi:hypothetical protein
MVLSIGIYRPEQLRKLRINTLYGRRRKFALDLLEEIEQLGNNKVRGAFLETLADGAGVFKRTYSGRFPAFDMQLLDFMAKLQFPLPLRILDVAISDGSTSVDFFNGIAAHVTKEFTFIGTDRDISYLVVNEKKSPRERVIITRRADILQVIRPPFVFNGAHLERFLLFPINRMVRPYAMRYAKRLVERWKHNDPALEQRELIFACKPFRDLLAKDSRLKFTAWDITTPWTGEKAHCVRAMNILNPSYFSNERLAAIVRNLMESTVEGGLIAIGSNEGPESEVDGAIYSVEGGRLIELISTGAGARCRPAIEQLLAGS